MNSRIRRHAPIGPFVAVADVRGDGDGDGLDPFVAVAGAARADREYAERAGGESRGPLAGTFRPVRADDFRRRWRRRRCRDPFAVDRQAGAGAVDIAGGPGVVECLAGMGVGYEGGARCEWPRDRGAQRLVFAAQFDARLLGAILAGMPAARHKPQVGLRRSGLTTRFKTGWNRRTGCRTSERNRRAGGLRGNIMRTPGQRPAELRAGGVDE